LVLEEEVEQIQMEKFIINDKLDKEDWEELEDVEIDTEERYCILAVFAPK